MRRKLTAIVLAVLVFGLIAASAASLGGIDTANIGSDVAIVAACDVTDAPDAAPGTENLHVNFGTPSFNPGTSLYEVDTVNVTGIDDACVGQAMEVTIAQSDGTVLATANVASIASNAGGDNNTASPTFTAVDAELIGQVAIVISG